MANDALIEVRGLTIRFRKTQQKGGTLKSALAGMLKGSRGRGVVGGQASDGYIYALHGISFDVRVSERLGVVGNNGAGKSTLLQALSGIYAPHEGEVIIHARMGALLSLSAGLNPQLTGLDNIYLFGMLQGLSRRQVAERMGEIIEFSELDDFIYAQVRTYSSGMRARLGFSIASAIAPEILLLDEVLGVGDIHFRKKCRIRLEEMMGAVQGMVIVTHDMNFVRGYCNKALWLDKGRVRMDGDVETVLAAYEDSAGGGKKK